MDLATILLSRVQFGMTASFHFLFVPLTIGLAWILLIMELCYLVTGKEMYRDMTKFWAKLFAINFVMGVITGTTLEFEFGLNWAYFSRFVGNTFGTPLAIEGITAFMLEATFFGLFFFTWNKVSKYWHVVFTFLLALGGSLSAFNIMVANTWMAHPTFTSFNYHNLTMNLTNLFGVYFTEDAQSRIGHILLACMMTASVVVVGISAWYLLKRRDVLFALRSMTIAVVFGIFSVGGVVFMGDISGQDIAKYEPMKMAALEGEWITHQAPAPWVLFAIPNQHAMRNYAEVSLPYALGIIATHSLTKIVPGIDMLSQENYGNIRSGVKAYDALYRLRTHEGKINDPKILQDNFHNIGYAYLLIQAANFQTQPNSYHLNQALQDKNIMHRTVISAIPEVPVVFSAFRIMIGIWIVITLSLLVTAYRLARKKIHTSKKFLWILLWLIPLPYIASIAGWFVAEMGRQPWVVHGILPTAFGVSSLHPGSVIVSIIAFFLFYVTLFSIMLYLMFKYARLGPSCLKTGRYYFEKIKKDQPKDAGEE